MLLIRTSLSIDPLTMYFGALRLALSKSMNHNLCMCGVYSQFEIINVAFEVRVWKHESAGLSNSKYCIHYGSRTRHSMHKSIDICT